MPPSTTKPLLFLVEDDPQMGLIVGMLCRREGVEVVHVLDGTSAWERLRTEEKQADLVLLDVNLPGISGVELCRRIRSDERLSGQRIGLFVGGSMVDDIAAGWSAGADFLVHKELVTQPADWQRRLREILPGNSSQNAFGSLGSTPSDSSSSGVLGSGCRSFREWLGAVNQALGVLEGRLPGQAVLVAVVERAVGRARDTGARGSAPPPEEWLLQKSGRLTTGTGSGTVRLAALVELLTSLAEQSEGLLGAENSDPFRQALTCLGLGSRRRT
jgi:CheY-like chemotaxis protein